MAFQEFELNMIPHGDMPTFYASQYETGRPIIIDIMMGEDAFACDELYIELHCRKVDDNIVTLEPNSVDGNQVVFVGTDQLFACPGKNLCEVCLYADETKDTSLGSLNFFIEVEPDPLAGGLTSETQIYDLYQQVEAITEQVIGNDYYDKDEVDALLDDKADKSNTYTKTEVDNALNLKADKSTTYTKTQTDNLLNDKADKATTYTKTQVDSALALKANSADLATVATTGDYDDLINKPTIPAAQVQSDWSQADNTQVDYIKNKPDINAMIANALFAVMPVATEGPAAICNFDTEIAAPLQSVLAEVVATQAAGTPTPSNPLPISGHTEVNITRCGVNLIDDSIRDFNDGAISFSTSTYGKTIWLPAGTYTFSVVTADGTSTNLYGKNLDTSENIFTQYSALSKTFTLATACNVALWVYKAGYTSVNDITSAQVEVGSTATPYHAYNGDTVIISFGQTVYGGVLDVTNGTLTVTWGYVDMGTLGYTYQAGDHSRFSATVNGIKQPSASNVKGNIITSIFITDTADNIYNHTNNNAIAVMHNNPYIWIYDSDYTDATTFKTAMDGVQLVYELATPFDIDLTPEQINAIVGENNVYSDTGNTTVRYKDSIQHYIDTRP